MSSATTTGARATPQVPRRPTDGRLAHRPGSTAITALADVWHGGRGTRPRACPRCGSRAVVGWGGFSGRRRFRCRGCRRTFSDFTATPFFRSRYPLHWHAFAGCMRDGLSVRAAGHRIGVHKDTAWRWRHRLLAGLAPREQELLQEQVYLGQGLFPHSEKGARGLQRGHYPRRYLDPDRPLIRVLFARDVHRRSLAAVLTAEVMGRPTLDEVRAHLLPRLGNVCVLRSQWGRYGPLGALCRKAEPVGGRPCRPVRSLSCELVRHSRVIAAYRFELRRWLRRFHGVSSRYLANYLHWFRLVDPGEAESAPRLLLRALCL